MIEHLEEMRYKYLNAYNDGPYVDLKEMNRDMVTIIYALQTLIDPFKDFHMEVK
jgi:hypothetical protein